MTTAREIRDVIHGSIGVKLEELKVIDHPFFQRLRQIKQLGFGEYSFPSATHNRYIHSVGTMEIATEAFDTIFGGPRARCATPSESIHLFENKTEKRDRLRAALRLAALLHDIGHGPLSHTTEFAMPKLKELNLPIKPKDENALNARASHEDFTLKIILDSSLTPLIEKTGKLHGFEPMHVASLINPEIKIEDDFFIEDIGGSKIDFQPVLHQIISSELDADRMDYLKRDSLHTGVSYGEFDYDWIAGNLTAYIKNDSCYLAMQHRALYAFEDFLLSRFHMFLMVYFHYKSVVFDEMLTQYFMNPDCTYSLPSDIEAYQNINDAHLYTHLANSKNEWAKRITDKRTFKLLVELHSGIPATTKSISAQRELLDSIKNDLKINNIFYLESTSTGELSKYFRKPGLPIYVRYDNLFSNPCFIPLVQCTMLFEKYNEKRSITRIYISPESSKFYRHKERVSPLTYESLAY